MRFSSTLKQTISTRIGWFSRRLQGLQVCVFHPIQSVTCKDWPYHKPTPDQHFPRLRSMYIPGERRSRSRHRRHEYTVRPSWTHSCHSITWIRAGLGVKRGGPAWILWSSCYYTWKLCSPLDSWGKKRGLEVVFRTSEVRVNGAKEGERQQLIHSCPSVLYSSLSYTLDLHHFPRGLTDLIFISVFKI